MPLSEPDLRPVLAPNTHATLPTDRPELRIAMLALDVNLRRPRGDSTQVAVLVKSLAALGHRLEVFVEAGPEEPVAGTSCRFHTVPGLGTLGTAHIGIRVVDSSSSDVVYERRLFPKVGYLVSRATRRPLVVEVNGLPDEERAIASGEKVEGLWVRRVVRRALLRRSEYVVAVSDSIRRALILAYELEEDRVVVIPNGVNLDHFRPLESSHCRRLLGFPLSEVLLGFVGYLTEWQGVDVLLEVVDRMRRHGRHVGAVVVGDGPARPRLEELSHRLGISGAVRFTGTIPYELVPNYIGSCDVLFSVKPPLLAGSPLKIREYMACSRPVIASRGTAFDFAIVEEAGAGLLVDPRNPDEIAKATERILDHPDLGRRMGERGRSYVEQHCSWAAVARRVSEVCSWAV